MKYKLSKFLVKPNPYSDIILNTETGQRHEISEEALEILRLFKNAYKTFDDILDKIEASADDKEEIKVFLQHLADEKIIISENVVPQEGVLPFADGVLVESPMKTFLGCPAIDLESLETGDIAFLGVPFDLGTTGYPGARFAPDRMRELSSDAFEYRTDIFTGKSKGWFSLEREAHVLKNVRMVDVGNVLLCVGETFDAFYDRISQVVRILTRKGFFPAIIGGDHSCSYAILRAMKDEYESLQVIHIDAHTDLGELFPNVANNHGNVFTRIRSEGLIKHLYQFGVRSFAGRKIVDKNYSLFSLASLQKNGLENAVDSLTPCKYYLSIDIDVLDPSFAPGTGTPVSTGMNPTMLFELLSSVCKKVEIVGCDLVEVNPMLDVNNCTSELAIKILTHVLSEIFDK